MTEAEDIEFRGFSWRDDNGVPSLSKASTADQEAALVYLNRQYGVTRMHDCPPFLVLGCKHDPLDDPMPFTMGGSIEIWRVEGDMAFNPFPGEHGADIDTEGEVEESLL